MIAGNIRAPLAKWLSRAAEYAAIGGGANFTALLYCSCALPSLSYLSQFFPPPWGGTRTELNVLTRLLRLPGSPWRRQDWAALHLWGGPRIQSLLALSLATLLRSALKTFPGWRGLLARLVFFAKRELPVTRLTR